MIYTQKGLGHSNIRLKELNKDLITALEDMHPEVVPHGADLEKYKHTKAKYFVSGEFNPNEDGTYTRNDTNLLYRDYAIVDVEKKGKNNAEVTRIFNDKLAMFNCCYYPSIRHTEENPRYRVVIELDRNANKEEYKQLVPEIYDYLELNGDTTAKTFSQAQGLPIVTEENKAQYKVTAFRGGLKYTVKEVQPLQDKRQKNSNYYNDPSHSNITMSDDDFINIFIKYLAEDEKNLEHDYNNSLAVIMSLAKSVLSNQISYDVALEAVELLAFGNQDYIEGNIEKLNREIKQGLDKIATAYDIFQRMKATENTFIKYEINWKLGYLPKSDYEIYYRLSEIGKQWRIDNEEINEKGEVKEKKMGFNIIADYIIKNNHIVLIGETADSGGLYVYNYGKGIYEMSEAKIKKMILKLEYKYDLTHAKKVIEILRVTAKHVKKLSSPNLIAVNNGIFDLDNKVLLPFSPEYIITSKIATNYNKNAISEYEKNYKHIFDIDDWLMSIANNDNEIYTLLNQMAAEAINPNYTRRKIGIMLGSGKNGKGTYQSLLMNLIGNDNVSTLKPPQFATQFQLSQLVGKVCNIGDDISNKRLDEIDVLKSIASGDYITLDRKNKEPISVSFKTFLLFSANELPKTAEKSRAFIDRLLIVPFNADFSNEKEDKSIKLTHINNNYVLEYLLYKVLHLEHFEHFIIPEAVKMAVSRYEKDNDTILSFLHEEYIHRGAEQIARVPISAITNMYTNYCEEYNLTPRQNIGSVFLKALNNHSKDEKLDVIYERKRARLREADREQLKKIGIRYLDDEDTIHHVIERVSNVT